jgi:hypothetical protein
VEREEGEQVDAGGGDADAGEAESREAEGAVDEDPVQARVDRDRGDGDPQEGLGAAHAYGELADGLEPQAGQKAGGQREEHVLGEVDDVSVLAEPGQGLADEDHQDGAGESGECGEGHARPDYGTDLVVGRLPCGAAVADAVAAAVFLVGGSLRAGGRGGYPVADGGEQADAHGADLVEDDDGQTARGEFPGAEQTHHHRVGGGQRHLRELGQDQGYGEDAEGAAVAEEGFQHGSIGSRGVW